MPVTAHAIGPLVRAASLRLALRGVVRGGSAGLWLGVAGAAGFAAGRVFFGLPWYVAIPGGLVSLVIPSAIGAAIGVWKHHLPRRERALLVDRAVGSNEALITAIHQLEATGRTEALHHLDATPSDVRKALPIGAPRHARWSLVCATAVAALLLAMPRIHVALPRGPVDDPVVAEGIELREALQRPEAQALPDELKRQAEDTANALIDHELSPEEAAERLKELQDAIEQLETRLEPSKSLLDDLEEAANELDSPSLDGLADALSGADFGQAGDLAEALPDAMKQATPQERQDAAKQLQEAGERMQQSSDPGVQQMGDALEQAGESMEQEGQPGQQGQQGQLGGQENTLSPEEAQQLREALKQQQELGERLQQDREKLQQSEELSGATEGAQERLGGRSGSEGGDEGDEGEQGQGAGEGEGEGEGEGVARTTGAGAGAGTSGHTWEDEGEFDPEAGIAGAGGAFQPDANQGEHIDDFERFYRGTRLDDPDVALAGAQGDVVDGRVDVLVTRLTGSDEEAFAPELEVPASYQREAVEAIETETIPPAYREAVKTYFDR